LDVNSRPKKHVLFSLRRVMASSTKNIEDEVRRRAYDFGSNTVVPKAARRSFG
jgi:hypothetical protein